MPTDMLDRLQEGKLLVLQELIRESGHAVAGDGQEELAAFADYLVDEGTGARQSCISLWDYYLTLALAGKVPDRADRGAKLRALLEKAGSALREAAIVARALADRAGRPVARLDKFERQVDEFPSWVEECMLSWEMLGHPRKPLDRDQIARSQEAFRRGEYEDVGDILARLKAGGPLIKE